MTDTLEEPTRVPENPSTCLDNIFISASISQDSKVLKINISYHFGEVIDINGSGESPN